MEITFKTIEAEFIYLQARAKNAKLDGPSDKTIPYNAKYGKDCY